MASGAAIHRRDPSPSVIGDGIDERSHGTKIEELINSFTCADDSVYALLSKMKATAFSFNNHTDARSTRSNGLYTSSPDTTPIVMEKEKTVFDSFKSDNSTKDVESDVDILVIRFLPPEEWAGAAELLRGDEMLIYWSSSPDSGMESKHYSAGLAHRLSRLDADGRADTSFGYGHNGRPSCGHNAIVLFQHRDQSSIIDLLDEEKVREEKGETTSNSLGMLFPMEHSDSGVDHGEKVPPIPSISSDKAPEAKICLKEDELALVWSMKISVSAAQSQTSNEYEKPFLSLGRRGLLGIMGGDLKYQTLLSAMGLRDELRGSLGIRLPILVRVSI